jgi:NAD(P)-dependent dehydrogenase (short-subunit alcohol dehydrogenase family)
VLINNAGFQKDLPLTEISLEEWYRIIDIDLTGTFICSREAVKHMIKQNNRKGGCVIKSHQFINQYLNYIMFPTLLQRLALR